MAQAIETMTHSELARSLEGNFTSHHADVNGVRLHYVTGAQGEPLVLLGGWPQTWWQFHKIMPALARDYRVIAVDLRGMGGSSKPRAGYDKKTMAQDIRELVRRLGHETVNIAGHDIGAMVAQAFAANHPETTRKVVLLDVYHPDETFTAMTLLPSPAQHADGDITAGSAPYLWWFAFNQVRGLPEKLLQGRTREMFDSIFDQMLHDPGSIDSATRQVYARAYDSPDAIRAGNAWYQAFHQDIEDAKGYGPLAVPVLVLGGEHSIFSVLAAVMPGKGRDVRVAEVKGSGHYLPEEQPETVARHLAGFFG
ncbi:alpha/beta fold hydrolase [Streptomyces cellulosae]|uniref:alpha/beta fold hydrolase n=1 Tax=Streptomyces cellulosae TaxID=1968 RepID=UPI0004CA6D34|nr:alpha/beta hydrolase [Streptomyces cellulosae]